MQKPQTRTHGKRVAKKERPKKSSQIGDEEKRGVSRLLETTPEGWG